VAFAQGFDVKGKTALVTGANRGIGKSIVETLINHDAIKVYTAVRDLSLVQSLQSVYGAKIVPVQIDLTQADSIFRVAEQSQDVDLVVNNAGVLTSTSILDQKAIENLKFEFAVNVFGLLQMAQAYAPVLVKNKGAFVQLNSVASVRAVPFIGTYSASKAAAYSITQSLYQDLANQGVQILSVHPGPIATDMADAAGITDEAEEPSVVAQGIVTALKAGQFHLFPDSLAEKVGQAYANYAENVIES